jgi:hypothetical protein
MPPPDWQALQDKDLRSKFNQTVFEDMIQDLANFESIEKSCNILKQASDILPRKSNAKKGWYAFDEINLKQLATNWNHTKTEFEQVLSSKCDNELVNQARDRMKSARKTYQQACKRAKQLFTQSAIDRANNKKDAQGKWKAAEQLVSGFTGHHRKPADFVNMMDKEGNTAKTLQENAKTVQTHFADEVFGRTSKYDPAALDSLPQLTENPELGRQHCH